MNLETKLCVPCFQELQIKLQCVEDVLFCAVQHRTVNIERSVNGEGPIVSDR